MAEQVVLPAEKRERAGKGAARAVRRAGLVPCVVYGDGKDPQTISIEPRHIVRELEHGHFYNTVYEITVDGGKTEKALPRDTQFHPVKDLPLHVDFLRVSGSTKINVMIPVSIINEEECPGLRAGGILSVVRYEVELYCPADAIPDELVCDLAEREIGDTIHISDIALPAGTSPVISDRDFVIANISAARAEEELEELDAEDAEAGEEFGAESEEGEAAEGEAAETEEGEGESEEDKGE